ncbi:hypothetical protein PMAYCL1PPCAC_09918, partial [Pristionchus mayeri]
TLTECSPMHSVGSSSKHFNFDFTRFRYSLSLCCPRFCSLQGRPCLTFFLWFSIRLLSKFRYRSPERFNLHFTGFQKSLRHLRSHFSSFQSHSNMVVLLFFLNQRLLQPLDSVYYSGLLFLYPSDSFVCYFQFLHCSN